MAIPQVVSGVGAGSKRVDKNNVERVQRIQKNAQIQNASGGAYGDRLRNEGLAQGAPMDVSTPAMGMPTGQPSGRPSELPNQCPGVLPTLELTRYRGLQTRAPTA
jgi:hypothetical protein